MDAKIKAQVSEYRLAGLRGYLNQRKAQAAEIENHHEAAAHHERVARIEHELQALEQPKPQGGP